MSARLPPYPDPPPPVAAEIVFVAVNLADGRRLPSAVRVRTPIRMEEPPFDYQCVVDFEGLESWSRRAFGVTAFQALDLALRVARWNLWSHLRRWRFENEQGEDMSFIAEEPS